MPSTSAAPHRPVACRCPRPSRHPASAAWPGPHGRGRVAPASTRSRRFPHSRIMRSTGLRQLEPFRTYLRHPIVRSATPRVSDWHPQAWRWIELPSALSSSSSGGTWYIAASIASVAISVGSCASALPSMRFTIRSRQDFGDDAIERFTLLSDAKPRSAPRRLRPQANSASIVRVMTGGYLSDSGVDICASAAYPDDALVGRGMADKRTE